MRRALILLACILSPAFCGCWWGYSYSFQKGWHYNEELADKQFDETMETAVDSLTARKPKTAREWQEQQNEEFFGHR